MNTNERLARILLKDIYSMRAHGHVVPTDAEVKRVIRFLMQCHESDAPNPGLTAEAKVAGSLKCACDTIREARLFIEGKCPLPAKEVIELLRGAERDYRSALLAEPALRGSR